MPKWGQSWAEQDESVAPLSASLQLCLVSNRTASVSASVYGTMTPSVHGLKASDPGAPEGAC